MKTACISRPVLNKQGREACENNTEELIAGVFQSSNKVSLTKYRSQDEVFLLLKAMIIARGSATIIMTVHPNFYEEMKHNLLKYSDPHNLQPFEFDVSPTSLMKARHTSTHGVLVVGYEDRVVNGQLETFLILQNSQGVSFGANGYFMLSTKSPLFSAVREGVYFVSPKVDINQNKPLTVSREIISIADPQFRNLKVSTSALYLHLSPKPGRTSGIHFKFDENYSRFTELAGDDERAFLRRYHSDLPDFPQSRTLISTARDETDSKVKVDSFLPIAYSNKMGTAVVDWVRIPVLTRQEVAALAQAVLKFWQTKNFNSPRLGYIVNDSTFYFDSALFCRKNSLIFDSADAVKSERSASAVAAKLCRQLATIKEDKAAKDLDRLPSVGENSVEPVTSEVLVDGWRVVRAELRSSVFFFSAQGNLAFGNIPLEERMYAFPVECSYEYWKFEKDSLKYKVVAVDKRLCHLKSQHVSSLMSATAADFFSSPISSTVSEALAPLKSEASQTNEVLLNSLIVFRADTPLQLQTDIVVFNLPPHYYYPSVQKPSFDPFESPHFNLQFPVSTVKLLLPEKVNGGNAFMEFVSSRRRHTPPFNSLEVACPSVSQTSVDLKRLCVFFRLPMMQSKLPSPVQLSLSPLYYIMGDHKSIALTFECSGHADPSTKCTGFRFSDSFLHDSPDLAALMRFPQESDWKFIDRSSRHPLTLIVSISPSAPFLTAEFVVDFTYVEVTPTTTRETSAVVVLRSSFPSLIGEVSSLSLLLKTNYMKHFNMLNLCHSAHFFGEEAFQSAFKHKESLVGETCSYLTSYSGALPFFQTDDALEPASRSLYANKNAMQSLTCHLGSQVMVNATAYAHFTLECDALVNDWHLRECEVHQYYLKSNSKAMRETNKVGCDLHKSGKFFSLHSKSIRFIEQPDTIFAVRLGLNFKTFGDAERVRNMYLYDPNLQLCLDCQDSQRREYHIPFLPNRQYNLNAECTRKSVSLGPHPSLSFCTAYNFGEENVLFSKLSSFSRSSERVDHLRSVLLLQTRNDEIILGYAIRILKKPFLHSDLIVVRQARSPVHNYKSLDEELDIPTEITNLVTVSQTRDITLRRYKFINLNALSKFEGAVPYNVVFKVESETLQTAFLQETLDFDRSKLNYSQHERYHEIERYLALLSLPNLTLKGNVKRVAVIRYETMCSAEDTPSDLIKLVCQQQTALFH
eukprot:GDKJ01001707.1.p1 GENE.GDKJ01001707.1~~GDKJ01001707.1.p1  ORF type:complete len:1211 (+),score=223.01 GDKJ01001707.1:38-3634(+)